MQRESDANMFGSFYFRLLHVFEEERRGFQSTRSTVPPLVFDALSWKDCSHCSE
jgi:hypothetical protein